MILISMSRKLYTIACYCFICYSASIIIVIMMACSVTIGSDSAYRSLIRLFDQAVLKIVRLDS